MTLTCGTWRLVGRVCRLNFFGSSCTSERPDGAIMWLWRHLVHVVQMMPRGSCGSDGATWFRWRHHGGPAGLDTVVQYGALWPFKYGT